MPEWGQALSCVSPLTHSTEKIPFALGQQTSIDPAPALIIIIIFFPAFWTISQALLKHNIAKRLWT
ncbi:MAG: hypothetical protein ACLFV2_06955 [Desulfurivibrionaceae bacterium]